MITNKDWKLIKKTAIRALICAVIGNSFILSIFNLTGVNRTLIIGVISFILSLVLSMVLYYKSFEIVK